jgi:peptidoglycan/xylan/chitin deacetylase (PgdA/CDA1 family)
VTSAHVAAKRALSVPTLALRWLRRVPRSWILTFHEIGDHPWAVAPDAFRRIVGAVADVADVVRLAALVDEPPKARTRVAITFDDGYAGAAADALPWLVARGLPATVFLPTGLLRDEATVPPPESRLYAGLPLLGWHDVRRWQATGLVAFGGHGSTHRPLPALAPAERREELARCREDLLAHGCAEADTIAYPLGAFDEATLASAREAGFRIGLTTVHGGVGRRTPRLALPRVDVRRGYGPGDVLCAVRGDWDGLALAHRLRRRGAP